MADPIRLELSDGKSRKFWEVSTRGAELVVRFGRIGTDGQTQLKKLASPGAAAAEATKLTVSKIKKGYGPAGDKPNASAKARPATKPTGSQARLLTKDSSGDLGAMWIDGKDLWFAQVFEGDSGEEVLDGGGSLAEAVRGDGGAIERWRFPSPADAERAATWVAAHASKTTTIKNDRSADFASWTKRLKKERPCVPRLEVGSGPVTLTRDMTHPWFYPRVPSTSFVSKRLMVPVFSLVGPLDPRLGKQTGIFVSVCPQGVVSPYAEPAYEVVVQDPARKSTVDAYFESPRGGFSTVHLSMQIETIGEATAWAVTEHTGDKGSVGFYRTTHYKSRGEAEKAFSEKSSALTGSYNRVATLGGYYGKILDEITRHNRVTGQKPKTVKLRLAHGALVQSIAGAYATPSRNLLSYKLDDIGGPPRFCQEEWDFVPKNSWGKGSLFAIASVGDGSSPTWSEVLNDGDAGTINVYAAPGEPFGAVSFSCH